MTFTRRMSTKETSAVIFLNFGFIRVFDHFNLCLYLGIRFLCKYFNRKQRKENVTCFDRIVGCCVVKCDVTYCSKIFLTDRAASDKISLDTRGKQKGTTLGP
jgi:hypothetical protein